MTTETEPGGLVDVEYAARRLGRNRARVYELVREGLLPCVRMGRAVAFDPDALERWIADGGSALPGGWKREPDAAP